LFFLTLFLFNLFTFSEVLLITVNSLMPVIINFYLFYFRRIGNYRSYIFFSFLVSILNLIFMFSFLVLFNASLFILLITNLFASGISIIIIELNHSLLIRFRFKYISFRFIIQSIRYSIPIAFATFSDWFVNNYPRILITIMFGLLYGGYYSFVYRFSSIVGFFSGILQHTLQDYSLKNPSLFLKTFPKTFSVLIAILIVISYFIYFITEVYFTNFVGSNYIDSFVLVPFLLLPRFLISVSSIISIYFIIR
jgi:O-antigen/teichoic acid export membrane protein